MKLIKHFSLSIVCFLVFGTTFSQTDFYGPVKSKKARIKYINHIIENYGSTKTKFIWQSEPSKNMFYYTDGTTQEELYDDYQTIIHEYYHGVNEQYNDSAEFFINEHLTIIAPMSEVFKSLELNNVIPKTRQDSIFRYGLYVGGSNDLSGFGKTDLVNTSDDDLAYSVGYGIFGLMEEFSAYEAGFNAVIDMYTLFDEGYGKNDTTLWDEYFKSARNGQIAYREFQYFIGSYLNYSKLNYSDQYKVLMENKELRAVYTIMSENFESNIRKFDLLREKKKQYLTIEVQDQIDFDGTMDDRINAIMLSGFKREEIYKEKTYTENGIVKKKKVYILDENILKELTEFYDMVRSKLNPEGGDGLMLHFSRVDQQVNYLKSLLTPTLKQQLKTFTLEGCNEENVNKFIKM